MIHRSKAVAVLRVTSGNFLEMFDFFLFGFYSDSIGAAFFPSSDAFLRSMLVYAVFGVTFLMRPLGALILGPYIDRIGRRKGLLLTLSIMACGTVFIAFTPSYAAIGLLAPLIVVIGRLLQGFSAGVEIGGVSAYLAEMATPGRKGFYVAWQSAGQQVAVMFAALLGILLNTWLTPDQLADWGWRVPFWIGCAIVPFLFVIRRSLEESPEFAARKTHPTTRQIFDTLLSNAGVVALGMFMVSMTTIAFYSITIYTPEFGRQTLKLSAVDSLSAAFLIGLSNFIWLPIMGAISDRIGRMPLLITFSGLTLFTAYPVLHALVAAPSFGGMIATLMWLSFLYAGYNGAMVVALTEIVPASVRTAGFSLAYALATALFGGFTPAISKGLAARLQDAAAGGWWLTAGGAMGLVAALVARRRAASASA